MLWQPIMVSHKFSWDGIRKRKAFPKSSQIKLLIWFFYSSGRDLSRSIDDVGCLITERNETLVSGAYIDCGKSEPNQLELVLLR